jgi:hypothetical protein
MHRYKNIFPIVVAAALAGCATRSTVVINQPVGPDLAPAQVHLTPGTGQLVVYSALEAADPVSSDFPTHSGYEIDDAEGKLIQRVDNRSGSFYQMPAAVSLSPGKYLVKASASNYGLVTVPVIIKESETTTLDLEATHFRQHKPTGAGQWVRLPTGEVIGMKSP